jgi:hypothetical protein
MGGVEVRCVVGVAFEVRPRSYLPWAKYYICSLASKGVGVAVEVMHCPNEP